MNLLYVDSLNGKWKQHIGSAKIICDNLTDDELLRSECHEQKLIGLVQERYSIMREEAGRQAKGVLTS